MIDISKHSKPAILAALYNASKPQGLGILHYDPTPMTEQEAEELLATKQHFDYLKGRVMKVNLKGDELDPRGYDRDNGEGAALAVIMELGATGETNSDQLQKIHKEATASSIDTAEKQLVTDHSKSEGGTFHLGISDMKEHLRPAIEKARVGFPCSGTLRK